MSTPSYGPPPPVRPKLGDGPGKALASVTAILSVCIFHAVLVILVVYCFMALWPRPTPSGVKRTEPGQIQAASANASPPGVSSPTGTNAPQTNIGVVAGREESIYLDPQQGRLFGLKFMLYNDVRLFVLVLLAGALGSSVHALRSMSWYAGNRAFVTSWLLYYYLKPFTGAGLAATFYFVIRGGFFSSAANFSETSPFGFCALAALIGLFSESAILKLKEIADTIFLKPKPGTDAVPQPANDNQGRPIPNGRPGGTAGGIPGAPNPPPPPKR